MKVGILGGTFDPIHNGHIEIAQYAMRKLDLDEVWFLVNNIPPHKIKNSNSTNKDRLNMLKIALNKYPKFKVCDIELYRDGLSYTYDTIQELKHQYPNNNYYFIVGGDNVDILNQWYKIDELVQLVQFVAFKRRGSKLRTDYNIIEMDMDLFDVSSTDIRNGRFHHLDPNVLHYIKEVGLYGIK